MALVTINWKPTDRQLRQFGLICLLALPTIGWIWSHGNRSVTLILAAVGVVAAAIGMLFPRALKPVFIGLSVLTIPIGMVVGELAMALIFFGAFVPIALLFRLLKRDRLQLKANKNTRSYWLEKPQPQEAASYFRQF